eukprot:9251140-Pyramimonas_sp.AAC.1
MTLRGDIISGIGVVPRQTGGVRWGGAGVQASGHWRQKYISTHRVGGEKEASVVASGGRRQPALPELQRQRIRALEAPCARPSTVHVVSTEQCGDSRRDCSLTMTGGYRH